MAGYLSRKQSLLTDGGSIPPLSAIYLSCQRLAPKGARKAESAGVWREPCSRGAKHLKPVRERAGIWTIVLRCEQVQPKTSVGWKDHDMNRMGKTAWGWCAVTGPRRR